MIVITGAAGFIGSVLVGRLNSEGHSDLVLVDDFSGEKKNLNLVHKQFAEKVETDMFIEWFRDNHHRVNFVFHIGAKTDTTEMRPGVFEKSIISYTKDIWEICTDHSIPLVYASSAATYGRGENGYSDSHTVVDSLKPLNPYGIAKNDFDKWALLQEKIPPLWIGLKFFNVYGPNEYHKARMSSVVFNSFMQIQKEGKVTLFKSHNPDYEDGAQLRDFVYVKDVVNVCMFFLKNQVDSGLYNVGTGHARTFLDLTRAVFKALHKEEHIEYVETPLDIRERYQYFTEADITKLRKAGYTKDFHSIEDGVRDYVQNYLVTHTYY